MSVNTTIHRATRIVIKDKAHDGFVWRKVIIETDDGPVEFDVFGDGALPAIETPVEEAA